MISGKRLISEVLFITLTRAHLSHNKLSFLAEGEIEGGSRTPKTGANSFTGDASLEGRKIFLSMYYKYCAYVRRVLDYIVRFVLLDTNVPEYPKLTNSAGKSSSL